MAIGEVTPEIQKLLDVTSETLNLAIRAMARCRYWSEVASLMERFVKSQGFYVVEKFVGHGIGQDMHEEPQVPNFVSQALRQNDIKLEPGVVLAIEPMVAIGTKEVRTLERWLDRRDQGSPSECPLRAYRRHDPRRPARIDLPGGLIGSFRHASRIRLGLSGLSRRAAPPGIRSLERPASHKFAEWDGPLLRDDGITSKLAKFGFGLGVTRFES